MTTLLFTLGVFGVALAGMAVGVIFSNKRLKGSCGGLNNFRDSAGKPVCEGCTNPAPDCSRRAAEAAATAEAAR